MLKPENKIFKNLYNEHGWEIENALKRDDWKDTKNIILKGDTPKPGSYRGRVNNEPENNRKTLMELKNA